MMTLDEWMRLDWETVVEEDVCDGQPCFVARNPELGSCLGMGYTVDEALQDLVEARRDLLSVMLEMGDPIPVPMPRHLVTTTSDRRASSTRGAAAGAARPQTTNCPQIAAFSL